MTNKKYQPRHVAHHSVEATESTLSIKRAAARGFGATVGYTLASLALAAPFVSHGFNQNVAAAATAEPADIQMSQFASELVGKRVWVDCNDTAIAQTQSALQGSDTGTETSRLEGYVKPLQYGPVAYLPPVMTLRESICQTVLNFNATTADPTLTDTAYATYVAGHGFSYMQDIATILHEAEHTNQVWNEAQASCNAYQKLPEALGRLGIGISGDDATRFAQIGAEYYAEVAPDEYTSDECAPGGAYDLGISDVYVTRKP